uniref:Uncharacterized protein n=1 Tax=Babesia bovis TaxID=5865 RepID=S6C7E2_BABBO|nr:hypothetical protein [Babesia bovis]
MQYTDTPTHEITFTVMVFCFMMAGIFTSAKFGGLPYINSFFLLAFLLSKFTVGEENEDGTETLGTKQFGYDLFEGPWGKMAFFSALAVVLMVLCGIFLWRGIKEQNEEKSAQTLPNDKKPKGNIIAAIVIVAIFIILAILMSADSYGLYKRPLTSDQLLCLSFAYIGVAIVIIIMISVILVVTEITDKSKVIKYAIPSTVIISLVIYALCNGLVDFNELSVYLRSTPEDPDAGKDARPPNA